MRQTYCNHHGYSRHHSSLLSRGASIWIALAAILVISGSLPLQAQKSRDQRRPDASEHFKKWLKEDVVYIISEEEKEIFSKLTTDEEREAFIEQFWTRRNPNPSSLDNDFKAEHYRRIQYANDWFRSGEAGWKTDRGRIYVMYGKPTEVTRYNGGQYERSYNEGGGVTTTWPFEKWVYRHIDGIGDNVELEFVDDTLAGEYHLAMFPWEKDALLNVPNVGLTMEESLGLVPKSDRIRNLYASNPQTTPFNAPAFRDSIFERLHSYFTLQRPPAIQFKDLKEIVSANIQYNLVPFQVRADWVYLGADEALVPITLKIQNQDLTYQTTLGSQQATVNVYGSVRNLQGNTVAEFEDTLTTDYTPETFAYRSFQNSVYQKQVVLKPGLYRLDLVIKDVAGGKTGALQMRLQVPKIGQEALSLSPVILSKKVLELKKTGAGPGLFEVGDLRIIPEVGDTFTVRDLLHFYVQVYNVRMDQVTGNPSLAIAYTLRDSNGKTLQNKIDEKGDLIHYHSPQRVVCLESIPLRDLSPGSYRIDLEILDRLTNQRVTTSASFKLDAGLLQTRK